MRTDYTKIFKEEKQDEPKCSGLDTCVPIQEGACYGIDLGVESDVNVNKVINVEPETVVEAPTYKEDAFSASIIKDMNINLRKEKNLKSEAIQNINSNDVLMLEESDGIWVKVTTVKGNTGYIPSKFIVF